MVEPPSQGLLQAWVEGVEEFNEGRYWHAHEAWERGWKRLPEPHRSYVQALIQVAAMFHLLEKGRARPAFALAESALGKLERTLATPELLPPLAIPDAPACLRSILGARDPGQALALRSTLKAVLLLPPAV